MKYKRTPLWWHGQTPLYAYSVGTAQSLHSEQISQRPTCHFQLLPTDLANWCPHNFLYLSGLDSGHSTATGAPTGQDWQHQMLLPPNPPRLKGLPPLPATVSGCICFFQGAPCVVRGREALVIGKGGVADCWSFRGSQSSSGDLCLLFTLSGETMAEADLQWRCQGSRESCPSHQLSPNDVTYWGSLLLNYFAKWDFLIL